MWSRAFLNRAWRVSSGLSSFWIALKTQFYMRKLWLWECLLLRDWWGKPDLSAFRMAKYVWTSWVECPGSPWRGAGFEMTADDKEAMLAGCTGSEYKDLLSPPPNVCPLLKTLQESALTFIKHAEAASPQDKCSMTVLNLQTSSQTVKHIIKHGMLWGTVRCKLSQH